MIDDFLCKLSLPRLSSDQLKELNAPFSLSEVHSAIDSLPLNKSPGPDGFVREYYRSFKQILSPHLVGLFNGAVASASFPSEMLKALIITLPKPGKDLTEPQNFRPISLLDNDLKLYAKLIARRVNEVLPDFVHPDQSGIMKGCQTSDATRRLINIIHQADHARTPSLLHWMRRRHSTGCTGGTSPRC